MARLKESESRSFQSFDAERISEALRRTIRQITDATLISARPTVLSMVMVEDVMEDVVEDIVEDIIDDSMGPSHLLARSLIVDRLSPYMAQDLLFVTNYKYFSGFPTSVEIREGRD